MQIKITLAKSLIAVLPAHKKTAISLGLRRPGDFIVLDDTPAVRGKVKAITHLVKVDEIKSEGGKKR